MKLATRSDLEQIIKPQVRENVFIAFKKVDRKLFVPDKFRLHAYVNNSIPLGKYSSISQPSLVAEMIDLLDLKGSEKVLEIGTGSGYSASILSFCCEVVQTIEIDEKLAKLAKSRLKMLGIDNVNVHVGDGAKGLAKKAPFDGIIFTAAVERVPGTIINQLKIGGRIVYPIEYNKDNQYLIKGFKKEDKLIEDRITPVRFVRLI